MAGIKMVTVGNVRYRPEDAPKRAQKDDEGKVQHKARTPADTAKPSAKKQDK